MATYAALDLIAALKNPRPETPLFVGDEQFRALTELAEIFATSIYPKLIPSNIATSPRIGKTSSHILYVRTQGDTTSYAVWTSRGRPDQNKAHENISETRDTGSATHWQATQ